VTPAGSGTLDVVDVRDLSRGLRLVTFTGGDLADRPWTPGEEIQVRVGGTARRHYTPMAFDPHTGRCLILFQLLVPGPGTGWARRLAPGDGVEFRGPHGGVRPLPGTHHLYLGDATAIGAFRALLDHPRTRPGTARGALEVAPHDAAAARDLIPELEVLAHDGAPGAALARWLDAPAPQPDACRLIGHANSLRVLRRRLVRAGVPRRSIDLKPYWATGRTGL
jgi:NADPH-dependent ferric siderophore reductase